MKSLLYKHTNTQQFIGSIVGMFLLLILFFPIYSAAEHIYEKLSPTEDWFEYKAITPFHKEFERGETIRFITSAEYKRELEVQWFDTLWCDTGEYHIRLATQITPEQPTFKEPSVVGLAEEDGTYPTWAYTEEEIPSYAMTCRLQSYIVATTPLGYKKSQLYVTDWFYVNR